MSVLDLPISRQMELAKRYNMSLSDWQKHIRSVLQEMDGVFSQIKPNPNFDKRRAYRFTEMTDKSTIVRLSVKFQGFESGKHLYFNENIKKSLMK